MLVLNVEPDLDPNCLYRLSISKQQKSPLARKELKKMQYTDIVKIWCNDDLDKFAHHGLYC